MPASELVCARRQRVSAHVRLGARRVQPAALRDAQMRRAAADEKLRHRGWRSAGKRCAQAPAGRRVSSQRSVSGSAACSHHELHQLALQPARAPCVLTQHARGKRARRRRQASGAAHAPPCNSLAVCNSPSSGASLARRLSNACGHVGGHAVSTTTTCTAAMEQAERQARRQVIFWSYDGPSRRACPSLSHVVGRVRRAAPHGGGWRQAGAQREHQRRAPRWRKRPGACPRAHAPRVFAAAARACVCTCAARASWCSHARRRQPL